MIAVEIVLHFGDESARFATVPPANGDDEQRQQLVRAFFDVVDEAQAWIGRRPEAVPCAEVLAGDLARLAEGVPPSGPVGRYLGGQPITYGHSFTYDERTEGGAR